MALGNVFISTLDIIYTTATKHNPAVLFYLQILHNTFADCTYTLGVSEKHRIWEIRTEFRSSTYSYYISDLYDNI